jgi:hypothetical protein
MPFEKEANQITAFSYLSSYYRDSIGYKKGTANGQTSQITDGLSQARLIIPSSILERMKFDMIQFAKKT